MQILIVALFVSLLAAPAQAQDRGLYIGFQQGWALPSTFSAPLSGNSQPTRCDSLLYPSGMVTATDCPPTSPRLIYSTDFDLGAGDSSAIQIGYDWGWFRLEVESLISFPVSDSSPIFASDDPVASGKASEWNVDNPPFARVSDVRAHQLFANVYYDFENDSTWTPFAGFGAGIGCVLPRLQQPLRPQDESRRASTRPAASTPQPGPRSPTGNATPPARSARSTPRSATTSSPSRSSAASTVP